MSKESFLANKRKVLSEEQEISLMKFRVTNRDPRPVVDGDGMYQVMKIGYGPNRGIGSVVYGRVNGQERVYRADIYGTTVYTKSEINDNRLQENNSDYSEEPPAIDSSERRD